MSGIRKRSALALAVGRVPALVRYILRNAAIGAALGVALALLLVATDAAGLRSLMAESADPTTPMLLLAVGFATLFGGLYAGYAIMMLPEEH